MGKTRIKFEQKRDEESAAEWYQIAWKLQEYVGKKVPLTIGAADEMDRERIGTAEIVEVRVSPDTMVIVYNTDMHLGHKLTFE